MQLQKTTPQKAERPTQRPDAEITGLNRISQPPAQVYRKILTPNYYLCPAGVSVIYIAIVNLSLNYPLMLKPENVVTVHRSVVRSAEAVADAPDVLRPPLYYLYVIFPAARYRSTPLWPKNRKASYHQ
jgi:hypothetical protein